MQVAFTSVLGSLALTNCFTRADGPYTTNLKYRAEIAAKRSINHINCWSDNCSVKRPRGKPRMRWKDVRRDMMEDMGNRELNVSLTSGMALWREVWRLLNPAPWSIYGLWLSRRTEMIRRRWFKFLRAFIIYIYISRSAGWAAEFGGIVGWMSSGDCRMNGCGIDGVIARL